MALWEVSDSECPTKPTNLDNQPDPPTPSLHHAHPASRAADVADKTPLKDQHTRSPRSRSEGFDSGNAVTFFSPTSPSSSPFSPALIHSSHRQAARFNSCSVSLEPLSEWERRQIRDKREREDTRRCGEWSGLRRRNRAKLLRNNSNNPIQTNTKQLLPFWS